MFAENVENVENVEKWNFPCYRGKAVRFCRALMKKIILKLEKENLEISGREILLWFTNIGALGMI